MRPFQYFRVWTRRAPREERVTAAIGATLALALLAWLLVPAGGNGGGQESAVSAGSSAGEGAVTVPKTAGGQAVAQPESPGATTAVGGPVAAVPHGAVSPGSGSGSGGVQWSSGTGTGGCTSPPGTDQGVTATEIKIAVILLVVINDAGNSAEGLPNTAEQQVMWQVAIDAQNAQGVACRKLVPQFFSANIIDSSDLRQKCLDIAQARPFAVLDIAAYYTQPALMSCFPQHQLPIFTGNLMPQQILEDGYPYLVAGTSYENLYKNTVFALDQRQFFSTANGFNKLGIIYRDCDPGLFDKFLGWLNAVGVPGSKVVSYNFGCPTGYATPADMQAAILKFKQNNVTHATGVLETADFANFTTLAQQQGFRPKWGLGQDCTAPGATQKPDPNNLAGAVCVLPYRYGEEATPGTKPTAATAKCSAIYEAKGRPSVYKQETEGLMCGLTWLVSAAIDHAPSLHRNALGVGLHTARSVELSYPWGPNVFNDPKALYGHNFWRVSQFVSSCQCWQVPDPTFHPSFP